jgi:hypothetical protein
MATPAQGLGKGEGIWAAKDSGSRSLAAATSKERTRRQTAASRGARHRLRRVEEEENGKCRRGAPHRGK